MASCMETQSFAPNSVSHLQLDSELIEVPALPSTDESTCATSEENTIDEALSELPPVLQSIADERREFQMNLGKAMDTIRKDMPEILKRAPGKETHTESNAWFVLWKNTSHFQPPRRLQYLSP
jgi:hypothetical protein